MGKRLVLHTSFFLKAKFFSFDLLDFSIAENYAYTIYIFYPHTLEKNLKSIITGRERLIRTRLIRSST